LAKPAGFKSKPKFMRPAEKGSLNNEQEEAPMPSKSPPRNVIFGIGFYALCSSSMLFFNKLSVTSEGPPQEFKMLPGPISCIQLLFANVFCFLLWASGMESFGDLRNMHTLKMYTIYSVLFVGT